MARYSHDIQKRCDARVAKQLARALSVVSKVTYHKDVTGNIEDRHYKELLEVVETLHTLLGEYGG